MTYTITCEKIASQDPRLKRNVNHDSRSRQYAYPVSAGPLFSTAHTRYAPIFDQGNLGSCTGNAALGDCGTGVLYQPIKDNYIKIYFDETDAVRIYSLATTLDPFPGAYPPEDTGSDGLSVAKACKQLGLISGYQHAFSLDAALSALQNYPVITGVNWYDNMFEPSADGQLTLAGPVVGGHEFVVDEIDVQNERVWMTNSWGSGWGIRGRAWLTWDDWDQLLREQGDVTVLLPLTAPVPVPVPPEPPVPPLPTPDQNDVAFASSLHVWLNRKPWFYRPVQNDAKTWLANKGL